MDARRFDVLSRALATTPSRRGALRLLAGASFGRLVAPGADDVAAHNALKKCKKLKDKAKRKKCLKKARSHNAAHRTPPPGATSPPRGSTPPPCVPQCDGKACGPDGCGSVCGICAVAICQTATCTAGGECAISPLPDGAGCGGPCQECRGGTCSGIKADGVSCGTCRICVGGACEPDSAGTICAQASCNGLTLTPQASCDGAGRCRTQAPINCDDGNPCTADLCDQDAGICLHADKPDWSSCGPNDSFCQGGQCHSCRGTQLPCEDVRQCCGENVGCVQVIPETTARFCCGASGHRCATDSDCCSGSCFEIFDDKFCFGRTHGAACTDDAQCLTGICRGGVCACEPDGTPCTQQTAFKCCSATCVSSTSRCGI
jgi:hypothetical protein